MRPHIRAATSDDAVALSRFARDAFHDTFAADNAPGDMEAYLREAFSPERQAAELAHPHRCCLLATVGGDLAGYASLMQDAAHPAVVAAHPVELERFYVARAWHGRGLAALLMQTAVGQARAWGTDVVWLGVWERNARAIRFYEKQGYETVGAQTFRLGSDLQRDCVMRVRLA
jgi:GNAT superfamily N-acetyltransferase